uniref:Putative portal protein n=1 Tax=viral metagenome TaxID=1070528 RepID=A0A6H1ZYE8_9ZZZZ
MSKLTFNILESSRAVDTSSSAGSIEKDQDVKYSEELLDFYKSEATTWRNQAQEDDDFRNNMQWSRTQEEQLKERNQAPIVINILHQAVEQAKSLLTSNKPRFSSTAREDSDVQAGKIFSDLMAYIWDISSGNSELKQAIDDYYVKGVGWICAYVDPNADFGKGEIYIKCIDPMEMFLDPNTKDIFCRDTPHMLIAKLIPGEQLQAMFMDLDISLLQRSTDDFKPASTRVASEGQRYISSYAHRDYYNLIDRYSKVKIPYFYIFDKNSGTEKNLNEQEFEQFKTQPAVILLSQNAPPKFITEDTEIKKMLELHSQTGGVFHFMIDPNSGNPIMMPGEEHELAIPGSQQQIEIVTMQDMMDQGLILVNQILIDRILRIMSAGGYLLYRGIMELDDYPIIPIMNRHLRNPYPMSDVRFNKGIQEYINKIYSLIIAHASNSTNVKLLIPEGSVKKEDIEKEFAKAGTAVIEYQAEIGIPIIATPIPMPNELYRNLADAKVSIQNNLGIYDFQQGSTQGAPQTYRGTVALDEFGQRRIQSKRDDIEAALNQLAKAVVQLIQKTYTEYKLIRLIQPNNALRESEINRPIYSDYGEIIGKMNDITVGKYDLIMVSGSTLPSNRWARGELYKELIQIGLPLHEELIRSLDVDAEKVLQRMDQIQQLQGALEEAQEEIKRLSGDLQTAERGEVEARKQTEVAKFSTQLKDVTYRAEAGTQVFKARLEDELKKEKTKEKVK